MQTSPRSARFPLLDFYRGTAVILMMVFHFCWDWRYFGYLEYSLQDPFWVTFRAIILTLFLTAVGWSNYLAVAMQQSLTRYLSNLGKLALGAGLVSLGSWLMFPNNWIFFGILHFILIAGLVGRSIAHLPVLSGALGILLISLPYILPQVDMSELRRWFSSALGMPRQTLDYVAPLPWLGVVLVGPLLGKLGVHHIHLPSTKAVTWVISLGRYALPIYLSHQVILFLLVALIHFGWQWVRGL
ncbi:DUF1624 domain-containing protein [Maribrevibacterium harenarium]|uniref:DUF1624 domain-containing protein n=1 Tax=Maribrevibacterium harenarium TaxID=2589817 RepID=A0A501X229_9GAMM|nr:heparan-alpha-glucosaminide N-acetyltransferase [Maribrevibacterium harenarium]TPE54531.1 DUF1624 domain-containing protein [Maribrevibacterium harenarium]